MGKEALSAVGGSTGMLTQMIVADFCRPFLRCFGYYSQYYGAKRPEMVGYAVHTAVAFSVVSGLVMTAVGIPLAPIMLTAMGTPEVWVGAFCRVPEDLFCRNGCKPDLQYRGGDFESSGRFKRPLHTLMFSCLINIALDILLVVMCGLGVKGAAIATILSQLLSAVLVCICLMRAQDMYRLESKRVRLDQRMLKRIVRIGFPAGLQSVMYGSSNVIIQQEIDSLGTNTVAAWAAYSKIDAVFWMMVNSFGIAITTFVGQNYGAGKTDRVHKGVRSCMKMTVISSALMSVLIYSLGNYCL